MSRFKAILLLVCMAVSCANSNTQSSTRIPVAPDYAQPVYWYDLQTSSHADADIFYVYPTIGTEPVDEQGNLLSYTDVTRKEEREAAVGNQRFNKQVYADGEFNFYAPYYRQMTMAVVRQGRDGMERMMEVSAGDIRRAFEYYMEHFNQGRPFVLLGHSQGSMVLLDLLRKMSDAHYARMVAAYLIGYEITEADLEDYPSRIKAAQGATDTGVIVSYNSVTDLAGRSPLFDRTVVCINPVNWTTDGTPALRSEHKGVHKFDKQQGCYVITPAYTAVRQEAHHLICPDVSAQEVYQEALKEFFPLGCLHFMDSWLYSVNLRENLRERTASADDRACEIVCASDGHLGDICKHKTKN